MIVFLRINVFCGFIAYFVFMVLITAIIDISGVNFLIPTSGGGISSSYLMVYFFMMTSTGIIIGFFSGKEYLNGIINSVIVAIFYSIFIGLYSGLFHFIEALVFLGVFGLIGSLIGVIIYRRYNNYNLIG